MNGNCIKYISIFAKYIAMIQHEDAAPQRSILCVCQFMYFDLMYSALIFRLSKGSPGQKSSSTT